MPASTVSVSGNINGTNFDHLLRGDAVSATYAFTDNSRTVYAHEFTQGRSVARVAAEATALLGQQSLEEGAPARVQFASMVDGIRFIPARPVALVSDSVSSVSSELQEPFNADLVDNSGSCFDRMLAAVTDLWWVHLMTLPVSSYVTQGLAKICNFQVLRHGTSFPNYLGVIRHGAQPSCGGSGATQIVSDESTQKACEDKFHLFKDSEDRFEIVDHVGVRVLPRLFAVLNSMVTENQIANKVLRVVANFFLAVVNFFCPTVRFIYRKSEITGIFENDSDYYGLGYRTAQVLASDRIGLRGVLSQATTQDVAQAWNDSPLQVLTGVAELVVGVALTALGVGIIL